MWNIYNEETAFYSWEICSFLLVDIGIFLDFPVLEKKKTKMYSFDSFRSSIFKNDQEKHPKNLIVLFIKLKSAKKDKTLLECVVSTSTAKHILKGVLVTKGKLKSDVGTISDLIRDEKYVDNNIHIFHLLWGLIWKILIGSIVRILHRQKVWNFTTRKKVQNDFAWFSENNSHEYWFGSMWGMVKMESFKLHSP